jgi:hypothetical protein
MLGGPVAIPNTAKGHMLAVAYPLLPLTNGLQSTMRQRLWKIDGIVSAKDRSLHYAKVLSEATMVAVSDSNTIAHFTLASK